MNRRSFIKQLSGVAGVSSTSIMGFSLSACNLSSSLSTPLFLSSSADSAGGYHIGAYDLHGRSSIDINIPERAHGMTVNPFHADEAIFFSRRPGSLLHRVSFSNPDQIQTIAATENRHFYGHGCFSADGNWLYTTENDFENGVGAIGVRDAKTLELHHEFPSYGIGPHELRLMPDGQTLVVANGGLLTHPDTPREVLNVDSMRPSLVYIDLKTGGLLGEYRLPDHQLSIRHIDVNANGLVAVTTQYQGSNFEQLPLLASHSGEDQLSFFEKSAYPWLGLQNYCGSVSFAKSTNPNINNDIAAVTSPRGGRIALLDFRKQEEVASFRAADVCGVGYSDVLSSFILSSGRGLMYQVDMTAVKLSAKKLNVEYEVSTSKGGESKLHWDNHLLVV